MSTASLGPASERRRLLENASWSLLAVVLLIAGLGIWNLASASRTAHAEVWVSQSYWLLFGLAVGVALCTFDYRHLLGVAYPIYGAVVALLILTLLVGDVRKGAQRWLVLGPVSLQTSELAKLAVVLALARWYHETPEPPGRYTLLKLWQPLLLVLLPAALILKQPDLGTALLVAAIGGSVILFGGIERWTAWIGGILSLVVVGSCVALFEFFGTDWMFFLKPYQRQRVMTFLNPEGDILGAGYHSAQSMIAVGSGGLGGKGWAEGTQTQLSFLPEQHTDFVFSVWAEEHGFLGGLLLLGLYGTFFVLAATIAHGAKDKFGAFLAVGVASIVFWQVLVNIGMVTGILPVVGVTLPLFSYGGSSLVTTLAGLAILFNVSMRRGAF
ncbi:MAG: rod shape-determining protein RodA [Deltaproteobacteria bacterium]|nr:MAG: rod shape-determining protein RodA [Deltaproteobacteria bacterium]